MNSTYIFEVYQDNTTQHRARMVEIQDQQKTILWDNRDSYHNKQDAIHSVELLRDCGAGYFETYTDASKGQQWRSRYVARNHLKIWASTQDYTSRDGALGLIELTKKHAPTADLVLKYEHAK